MVNWAINYNTQLSRQCPVMMVSYLPTKFSRTELLPALCPPTTAICGRSRSQLCPMALKASCRRFTSGMRSSIPRLPMVTEPRGYGAWITGLSKPLLLYNKKYSNWERDRNNLPNLNKLSFYPDITFILINYWWHTKPLLQSYCVTWRYKVVGFFVCTKCM